MSQVAPIGARTSVRVAMCLAVFTAGVTAAIPVRADEVVALGASNTYGKGVDRGEDFPAQLEQLLRAKGIAVKVSNAGVNGDTTSGMLSRLDGAIGADTKVVVLQPGGNDQRKGFSAEDKKANVDAIKEKLSARKIKVVMVTGEMMQGLPHQSDMMHLTPEGYRTLAQELLPKVVAALRH